MPLLIALTFFVFAFSTLANAWSPFAGKDIAEVALTPLELQKIKVAAGWAKGEDRPLILEVTNGLSGPIHCGAASVELNDGKKVNKTFIPKFSIPANASRSASMSVIKGSMKSYSLNCYCYKKADQNLCVSPTL